MGRPQLVLIISCINWMCYPWQIDDRSIVDEDIVYQAQLVSEETTVISLVCILIGSIVLMLNVMIHCVPPS